MLPPPEVCHAFRSHDHDAVIVRYADRQDARLAVRLALKQVPRGAHIFKRVNLPPLDDERDPMGQWGYFGVKWRAHA